ncbi:hypothetical protein BGZ63DRAFT_400700 [Mariannaea sp. PMI_226]|nr:hypothetical protein BGZ63DRAFT_400700 [Mariannaea sp. PMI_226]
MTDNDLERTQPESSEGMPSHDGGNTISNTEGPRKQSPYVPQFSTTASLILDRIKGGSRVPWSNQASIATGTASVEFPTESAVRSGTERTSVHGLSDTLLMPAAAVSETHHKSFFTETPEPTVSGVKRKRESPQRAVDFTQSTIAFPWVGQPKSTSSFSQPSEVVRNCLRCGGTLQLNGGSLDRSLCLACSAEREQPAQAMSTGRLEQQDETESLRRKRLATFPSNIIPAKPELVGFESGRASSLSRTEYFASKRKIDLLNILSLCDQLKPQLLVDVLVSVSKKHPDLPIFDSPDWESQLPSASHSGKVTATVEKPRHGHTVLTSKAKIKTKSTKKILKRTRVIEVITDAPGVDVDVLPLTWLKAGMGMYSGLAPDTEDRRLLMDENDEESFSHFMVDNLGNQIMETTG